MMFVTAQPESLAAAASRLEGVGSGLAAQNAATAAPMTGVVPAAADEVSIVTAAKFAGHAQMLVAGAGGDDHRFRLDRFAVHRQHKRLLGQIHFFHRAETGLGAKALRLFLHPRHQFKTVNALGKTGEIFHDAGGGEQSAGHFSCQDERREIGPRRVNGGGQPGAPGSDDDDFFHKDAQNSPSPGKLQARGNRAAPK